MILEGFFLIARSEVLEGGGMEELSKNCRRCGFSHIYIYIYIYI